LLTAKTSTAIVALLIATGFHFSGWLGVIPGSVSGVLYVVLVKGSTQSLVIRFDMWKDALEKVSGSLTTIIFGTGPGIYWEAGNMLHNELIYLDWRFGLIGVIIAALYIFRSIREIDNRAIFAMFLAVLVDGIGNHLMHTAPTAFVAVIVFGLKDRLRTPLWLADLHREDA